jgi:hypothetical protein
VKTSIVATILAVLAAALAANAFGERTGASFTVAVTVPLRMALESLDPAPIELTAQDVARGYKDVAARYRVRHNDRRGYVLEISTLDPVRAVEVRDFDDGVGQSRERVAAAVDVASRDAVTIRRPGAPFEQVLALQLRLVLDPSTRPGTFALPLHVVATPI